MGGVVRGRARGRERSSDIFVGLYVCAEVADFGDGDEGLR